MNPIIPIICVLGMGFPLVASSVEKSPQEAAQASEAKDNGPSAQEKLVKVIETAIMKDQKQDLKLLLAKIKGIYDKNGLEIINRIIANKSDQQAIADLLEHFKQYDEVNAQYLIDEVKLAH